MFDTCPLVYNTYEIYVTINRTYVQPNYRRCVIKDEITRTMRDNCLINWSVWTECLLISQFMY